MTPAQQRAYAEQMQKKMGQQVGDLADEYGMAIDKTILPGAEIKPPVKDIKRLSLIPSRPPTREQLLQGVETSRQQLQQGLPKVEVEEVKRIVVEKPTPQIQDAAMANFYDNKPGKAILLMINAVKQQPDSIILWNNLGAMFNMAGLEEKGIPMLMHCLEKVPQSSMILNNLGQGFMGLGELMQAEQYFRQCLALDDLNPDANHSMGMLHMYKKDFDEAMKHFNKELEISMRRSSLAYAFKMGKRVDLRALRNNKYRREGIVHQNYFEEIELGKFIIPEFPATVKQAWEMKAELDHFSASVSAESLYWQSIDFSPEVVEAEGRARPGLYHDLVEAMLEDLHKEFEPDFLSNFKGKPETDHILGIMERTRVDLAKIKCEPAPAGASVEVYAAYAKRCCEEQRRPLYDRQLAEISAYMRPKIEIGQQRWKSYLNQLIAIARLNPSSGNQLMVYRAVSGYFGFLSWAMLYSVMGQTELPDCDNDYNKAANDSLIAANHDWKMQCPEWLNVEVDLQIVKMKADCSKYAVEGGVGILGAYEKSFKTGTSTLMAGVGIKGKFLGGLVGAGAKQMAYISFDNNNQFADVGLKGSADASIGGSTSIGGIKVGGKAIGVEVGYTLGLNAGFTPVVKGSGLGAILK